MVTVTARINVRNGKVYLDKIGFQLTLGDPDLRVEDIDFVVFHPMVKLVQKWKVS
jgi:hypothetical protein